MARTPETSELVSAAEVIENDVRRLEELSTGARRIRLDTEKSIARAARELEQAMQQQERLAIGLRALGEVMLRTQGRQQAALEALGERATEIQSRMTRLSEHMQRFGALGVQAAEVAKVLQTLPSISAIAETAGSAPAVAHAAALLEVDARFTALVAEAKALAETARGEDFTDVAREAEALKQKVHSMRGRLAQLVRSQSAGTS